MGGLMADRVDETELKAIISEEIHNSILYERSELSDRRQRNLEYYQGIMRDTPAPVGRSQVMSRDIADTIGWMLPGIIRVFTASDRMAEYEPVKQADEAFAKQATDYCNHIFWKDNAGYRTLWDATHDSLLQGNAIVKHWWDDAEDCEYSEHSGMTEDQLALLAMEEGVEIVAQKEGAAQIVIVPGPDGQPMEQQLQTFDIKVKRVTDRGRVRLKCIKPEDFLLDRDATCIEDARFVAHRDEVTRTDLIEMGFDAAVVDDLAAYVHSGLTEERQSRDPDSEFMSGGQVGHRSMDLIEVYECYVRADADGDGIAETIRAYYAGQAGTGELLDWEVWDDDVPFSDIPCDPVPHRWDARSVADETIDVQRIKTVLTRQMLDNLYGHNQPMREVEEGSVLNPEMLTTPVFGGTIWRKRGAQPILPHVVPFVADKTMLALEYFDNVVEKRTGVSRATMALDPDTLQNQTATANQNQRDAAYSQIELIARNMAELGWRRVFRQILRLIVKNQDRPRTIRLRDDWVEMDPRHWNAEMDVTINVGLGTGSRDRDMSMLNNIMMTQMGLAERLAGTGFAEKALDMLPMIIRTATKLAEAAGIRNADEYYPQMKGEDVQQMKQMAAQAAQQPDPKMQLEQAKMQMQAQMDQARAQQQIQIEQAKMQTQVSKEAAEFEADMRTRQADAGLKQMEIETRMQIEREKMALTREIELLKLGMAAREDTGEVYSKQDERDGAMMAAMTKLIEGINSLQMMNSAPKRIVRDPQTGRAMGVETILN